MGLKITALQQGVGGVTIAIFLIAESQLEVGGVWIEDWFFTHLPLKCLGSGGSFTQLRGFEYSGVDWNRLSARDVHLLVC